MPAMPSKLISAVEFKYDRHLTDVILDTIESNLIDELNTPENHENLRRLRSYLHRRWVDIKPFKMRHLSVIKAIGCCESNHRKYTYRVKGQGKYWSEDGAEGILRVLTCRTTIDTKTLITIILIIVAIALACLPFYKRYQLFCLTKVGYWDILIQFLVIAGINLFIGFHNVNKATSIIEKIVGAFFPKTGAAIGLSMYQNPSFRNAITKAYH